MPSIDAMIAEPRPSDRVALPGHTLIWLALMFVPVLFAVTTWPGFAPDAQDKLRHLSIPVVGVELAVILLAMQDGLDFGAWFRGLSRWAQLTLALLVCIAFGTAIFAAIDRSEALIRTCTSLIHLLFGIGALHLFRNGWAALRGQVWPAILLGTVGYMIVLAAYIAASGDSNTIDWWRLNLGVTNIRQTGFYSMVGACAALGLAVNARTRAAYRLWIGGGAIMLALSFWGGTRSSLAAFLASIVIAFLASAAWRTRKLAITAAAIIAIAMPVSMIHDPGQPFMQLMRIFGASLPGEGDITTGRWEAWQATARMIFDHPLFGMGESQFRLVYEQWNGKFNHPHNWPLQIFFQWGLIGGACYFALAGMLARRFFEKVTAVGNPALPAVLVVHGVLAMSMVEGAMYHPYPISMLTVAVSWAFAIESAGAALRGRVPRPPHRAGPAI